MVMSSTEKSSCPIRVHTENFLVFICHPFRSGSGWCGKDRINAFFIQIVNYRFQPVKVIFPSSGSSTAQENIPMETVLICAFLKYSISFSECPVCPATAPGCNRHRAEMVISDLLCHFFFLLIFFIMTLYKRMLCDPLEAYYTIHLQLSTASFKFESYLTAPVIPSANCFCNTKNTIIVGMEQNNTPHISMP